MLKRLLAGPEAMGRIVTSWLLSWRWTEPVGRCLLHAYAWLRFCWVHHRVPGNGADDFSDFLFRVRISGVLREPLRKLITDKALAKGYVAERVGERHVVPTLAVLETGEAVRDYRPERFPAVLKPTHSSGRMVIVHDLAEYRAQSFRLGDWLRHDYFLLSLEENYRGLARRVLVEDFISPGYFLEGSIHCRQGEPKIVTVIDRFDPAKSRESFDVQYRPLRVALGCPYRPLALAQPACWPALLEAARALSRELAYVRVDFYASHEDFLIGELTNLPAGSYGRFSSSDGRERFAAAFFS